VWLALVVLLAAGVCAPFWARPRAPHDNDDWRHLAARYAALRRGVLTDGEFPLRAPYFMGGYPTLSDPEDGSVNPLTILPLVFGEVVGLKMMATVMFAIAAVGMFVYARRDRGLDGAAAALSAGVFATCSMLPARHLGGNVDEMFVAFIPIAFALWERAKSKAKHILPLSILLGLIVIDAKFVLPSLLLMLLLWAVLGGFDGSRRFDLRPAICWAGVALLTLAVGMVNVLPAVAWPSGDLELTYHGRYYGTETVASYVPAELLMRLLVPRWEDASWRDASFVFVGPACLVLAAIGLAARPRRSWRCAVLLAAAAWLTLAHGSPIDVFHALHCFAPFHLMKNPVKYFDPFIVFALACLAGEGFAALSARLSGRWMSAFVVATLLPLAWGATSMHGECVGSAAPSIRESERFHQVGGMKLPRNQVRPTEADTYLNVLRNVGTTDANMPVLLSCGAQPKHFIDADGSKRPNSYYRGLAYCLRKENAAAVTNGANPERRSGFQPLETRPGVCRANSLREASLRTEASSTFRANEMRLRARLAQPGRVVVNQNFHPSWRCTAGTVTSHNGLLAVDVKDAGDREIRFVYVPLAFYWGLGVTLAVLLTAVVTVRAWTRWLDRVLATAPRVSIWWIIGLGLVVGLGVWCVRVKPGIDIDALRARADAGLDAGRIEDAESASAELVRRAPGLAAGHVGLGRIAMHRRHWTRAVVHLREAKRLTPRSLEVGHYLSRALAHAGAGREALDVARELTIAAPLEAGAFADLAFAAQAAGDPRTRDEAMARAIELGADESAP